MSGFVTLIGRTRGARLSRGRVEVPARRKECRRKPFDGDVGRCQGRLTLVGSVRNASLQKLRRILDAHTEVAALARSNGKRPWL